MAISIATIKTKSPTAVTQGHTAAGHLRLLLSSVPLLLQVLIELIEIGMCHSWSCSEPIKNLLDLLQRFLAKVGGSEYLRLSQLHQLPEILNVIIIGSCINTSRQFKLIDPQPRIKAEFFGSVARSSIANNFDPDSR